MKNILLLVILVSMSCAAEVDGSGQTGQNNFGLHSWNGYHWASNNLTPQVLDKTKSGELDGMVSDDVSHWLSLGTPLQPKISADRKSSVEVVERFSTEWLGLAQIKLQNGHIIEGKVSLNTKYLLGDPRFSLNATRHVLCQELGHVWGLDHNREDLDTCMNDCLSATTEEEWLSCLNTPEGVNTNLHDTEQLNLTYNHEDQTSENDEDEPGGGPPGCDEGSTHPRCKSGKWVTVHTTPVW